MRTVPDPLNETVDPQFELLTPAAIVTVDPVTEPVSPSIVVMLVGSVLKEGCDEAPFDVRTKPDVLGATLFNVPLTPPVWTLY